MGDVPDEYIEKARRGNTRAFGIIVKECYPMVFSIVHAILGNREDTEDVVQNVFLKVYRGLGGFRGSSKFSTWIYRIARNEALNARKRFRPEFVDIESTNPVDAGAQGHDHFSRKLELSRRLQKALSRLDEDKRIAMELRYMAGLSYEEIAETMRAPVGTVKTNIFRAKAELKKILERDE